MESTPKERFLAAISGSKADRLPIWMMRQAGRYQASYQATRKGFDFVSLCRNVEAATKVSVSPIREIGMDACIIFSDILIPCEAMGMNLQFGEGGPFFDPPLNCPSCFGSLSDFDANEKTPFLGEIIKGARKELGDDFPVLGFCGAPFTMMAYMLMDVRGKHSLKKSLSLMFEHEQDYVAVLTKITNNLKGYLALQARAGATALQIFDTWAGLLSPDLHRKFVLPHLKELTAFVKEELKLPVTLFNQNLAGIMDQYIECEPSCISVDWKLDILKVRELVPKSIALQGNLQPELLTFAPDLCIEKFVHWAKELGEGYILNLGHGILPFTPEENVRRIVKTVQESI